ncbi:MAG: gliding motility-associated protein GldE [Bacteroidales bacterium]
METVCSEPYSLQAPLTAVLLWISQPAAFYLGLLAILLLLISSGLISGSEVAFFGLHGQNLEEYRKDSKPSSRRVVRLLENPEYLLATILISNNFVNVAIVLISSYITTLLFDTNLYPVLTFILQVIVVTGVILIFGEITPKIFSSVSPAFFLRRMSLPLLILEKIFWPISTLLVKSTGIIDRRMRKGEDPISLEEISDAIEIAATDNKEPQEVRIFKGIVRFGSISVREIMIPRVDVVAIDNNASYDEVIRIITSSGYSRIPVYSGSTDSINGILYIKDLLRHLEEGPGYNWQKHIRPAFFIPENKKIDSLLKEFQNNKIHMAIVVDEYGGTSGIVTLEDILEEIIGDINDEFDTEPEINYQKINENTFVFEGKVLLHDFLRIVNLPDDFFNDLEGDFDTLAGLILEIEGRLPEQGEVIFFRNLEMRIEEADQRRIGKIRVKVAYEEKDAT